MTRALALALGLAAVLARGAAAQAPSLVSPDALRVCADPNNLPYSNDKREGFENKVAELIGQDLGRPVTYVWFPQVVGFVRNTLRKNECDLVMGAVSGDQVMQNTNPYYHTGYMIVTRADSGITAREIGDPSLADKRFGLIAATPPTALLLKHDLMDHVTSYSLVVDTRYDSPSRQMLQDVVDGKIDVGLLWAPFVGFYIKRDHLPLKAEFLQPEGNDRLDFHITMGVRANEPDWRRRINEAIEHKQAEITKILDDYAIPRLDEQNRPIPIGGAAQ
ncbi:MAG TPA: substrate-binding domain-containing protein [Stellaceae bacterium]|nr:substrate-binding domain-containing protein [Stellaceae bacterium]